MTQLFAFRLLCVAAAGAAGAVCRWGLSRLANLLLGPHWPYGTLVVNVLGCLLFGFVFEAFRDRVPVNSHWRLLLLTGFAGAFTTYSTFAFDTYELAVQRHVLLAGLNLFLHLGLGLFAVIVGVSLGRLF